MALFDKLELLQSAGIAPSRARGQNFLFDDNVLRKIIDFAAIKAGENILEVGPGLGALTDYLLKKKANVLAVELDKKLFTLLEEKYKSDKNIAVINKDILKLTESDLALFGNKEYKVVANLPYSITSAAIRKLLELVRPPIEMTLMVQYEVAERIMAGPPDSSILALAVRYYSEPKIGFKVSRNCFYPRPKVDSGVIKLTGVSASRYALPADKFFALVRSGFRAKRKQLKNNLTPLFPMEKIVAAFAALKFNPAVRAEELGIDDWVRLGQYLQ